MNETLEFFSELFFDVGEVVAKLFITIAIVSFYAQQEMSIVMKSLIVLTFMIFVTKPVLTRALLSPVWKR